MSKANWIVAYEARSPLDVSGLTSSEEVVQEFFSIEWKNKVECFIALVRFERRKRAGSVIEWLQKKFQRCWIESSSAEAESVDLSFLSGDNKIKKHILSGNTQKGHEEKNRTDVKLELVFGGKDNEQLRAKDRREPKVDLLLLICG